MIHPRNTAVAVAVAGLLALLASAGQASVAPEALAAAPEAAASVAPVVAGGSRAMYTVGPHANCDFNNLQSAINNAGSGDTIRVAHNDGYVGQNYTVFNKSLTIQGGYSSCELSATANGQTVLNAQGSNLRVVDVWDGATTPMTVRLENLRLEGGRGGLLVEGQLGRLAVELVNSWVSNNAADAHGGGVRVRITGTTVASDTSAPILSVDNDSVIAQNSALGDGGGLFCSSSLAPDSHLQTSVRVGSALIMNNSAGGNGGGVANIGCQRMFMYTGGPVFLIIPTGGVLLNTAGGMGGGVYVGGGGLLQIRGDSYQGYGIDHAGVVNGNEADSGGGIAVSGQSSRAFLFGTVVNNNEADQVGGGALVTDRGLLHLSAQSVSDPCLPVVTGGGQQWTGPCSRLRGNKSAGTGAAMKVRNGGEVQLTQTYIQNNAITGEGSGAIVTVNLSSGAASEPASAVFESVLLAGNEARHLVYAGNRSQVDIHWSTVAGNANSHSAIRAWAASNSVNHVSLASSIFWDNNASGLVSSGTAGNGVNQIVGDCLIGQVQAGSSGVPNPTFYLFQDPQFLGPDDGNYRLGPTSPAIDFCDNLTGTLVSRDLAGNLRGQAWQGPEPGPNPGVGNYDLGAFEAQFDDDLIFANGFD